MSDIDNVISGKSHEQNPLQHHQQQQHLHPQYSVSFASEEVGAVSSSSVVPPPPPPSLVSTFPQTSRSNASNLLSSGPAKTTSTTTTTTTITAIANVNLNDKQLTTTTTTTSSELNATNPKDYQLSKSSNHKNPDQDEVEVNTKNCFGIFLKVAFSTPGLICLVIFYSILGAFIFPMLEAPQDITKLEMISKSREDCLKELWIITEKLNVLYERNWTMLVHEQLRRFEGSIVAATRNGVLSGNNAIVGGNSLKGNMKGVTSPTTTIGHFGGINDVALIGDGQWTFSEALIYSVTVITTIGHGSLTPKTASGKIATILYALIGVPLMLMCLSSLGALLAEALQCTYSRICCRLTSAEHANNGKRKPSSTQRRGSRSNHYRQTRCDSIDNYPEEDNDTAGGGDGDGDGAGNNGRNGNANGNGNGNGNGVGGLLASSRSKVKSSNLLDTTDDDDSFCMGVKEAGSGSTVGGGYEGVKLTHESKHHFMHDLHEQSTNSNKSLKYDSIRKEKTTNYEKKLKSCLKGSEESCQLLSHSPIKMNHTTKCMQMKTMSSPLTMNPTGQQYYQCVTMPLQQPQHQKQLQLQQQQHQQQLQQSSPQHHQGLQKAFVEQPKGQRNPEIMLMTTLGNVKNHALGCIRSVTLSPQHMQQKNQQQLQHQQQQQQPIQTYQLITTNLSPAHNGASIATGLIATNTLPASMTMSLPMQMTMSIPLNHAPPAPPPHHILQPQKQFATMPSGILKHSTNSSIPISLAPPSSSSSSSLPSASASLVPPLAAGLASSSLGKGSSQENQNESIVATSNGSNVVNDFLNQNQNSRQQSIVGLNPENVLPLTTPSCYQAAATTSNEMPFNAGCSTSAIYFPISNTTSLPSSTTAITNNQLMQHQQQPQQLQHQYSCKQQLQHLQQQQPGLVKYHTIHVPHQKKHHLSSEMENIMDMSFPPPPPAYQTATIGGPRRAKFLTKPLPQEINTLLAETDMFYRQNDSSQSLQFSSEDSLTTSMAMNCDGSTGSNPSAMSSSSLSQTPSLAGPTSTGTSILTTTAALANSLGSTISVDIMEDEEENEQQRLGDCPHGTPSRVPLIAQSVHQQYQDNNEPQQQQQQQKQKQEKCGGVLLNSSLSGSLQQHQQQQQQQNRPALHSFHRGHSLRRNCHVHSSNCQQQYHHRQTAHSQQQLHQLKEKQNGEKDTKSKSHGFLFSRSRKPKNGPSGSMDASICGRRASITIADTSDDDVDHDDGPDEDEVSAMGEIYSKKGSEEFILEPLHYGGKKRKSKAGTLKSYYTDSANGQDDEAEDNLWVCTCGKDDYVVGSRNYMDDNDVDNEAKAKNNDLNDVNNANHDADDENDDATSCHVSKGPEVPIYLVLLILLCYICVGTIIFAFWENWSLIDGAYFCFVTLTTIGYGDFIPIRTFNGPDVQLFACCAYLILGLVLVAMFFSILETKLMWKCRRIAVRLKLADN